MTESEAQTAEAAARLAGEDPSHRVFALYGPLGSGKTVFARALIRAFTGNPELEVPSPTFTLLQMYETTQIPVFHFDLYRLRDAEEVYELGWEEALAEGRVIIEWPERLGALIPANRLDIRFGGVENNPQYRKIEITPSET